MKTKLSFFIAANYKLSHIFASVIVAISMLVPGVAKAQYGSYDEAGFFLGAGYYNGEINPSAPFYRPKFAMGINLRHGFNDRMALAFEGTRCTLEGDDADFSDVYRQTRNASFKNELTELSMNFEYNFMPLVPGDPIQRVTPFAAVGLGVCVASLPGEGLRASIPFGVGVKFAPVPKWTFAFEWKYRKLFSDLLDHIGEDTYAADLGGASKQKSFLGNDDWFAFIGVVASYRLNSSSAPNRDCPAYK